MSRVLVTGANRGLGLELTRQCAARGDRVFATCRDPEAATELRALAQKPSEKGGRVSVVRCRVDDAGSIEEAFQAVRAESDALDLLINNAGYSGSSQADPAATKQFGRLDGEQLLGMFRVNAVAPTLVTQRFVSLLEAGHRPRVVNITSQLASLVDKTHGGNYGYCASKTALNMLTRAMAFDLLPRGVVAVMVHPGWVRTAMGGPTAPLSPEESARGILSVAEQLDEKQAGSFLNWDGTTHVW